MSVPAQELNAENMNWGSSSSSTSKFAVTKLSARIGAMLSLIVALAVFQTNHANLGHRYATLTFKGIRSYKYGFWVGLIGVGYTVLQIPLAIHYMLTNKHLINTYAFLKFDFYADKVVSFVVATAAGAVFGATMELKKTKSEVDNDTMQSFVTVMYIPAAFLLVGSIFCWISSLHSSLALSHKLIIAQQF